MTLTLTLREQPAVPLEAEVLSPDRLAGAGREEIEALPVWHGNERTRLASSSRSRARATTTCASRETCSACSASAQA